MNAPGDVLSLAARAGERVRDALRLWDAASLARCAECRQLLQLAMRELEAVKPAEMKAPDERLRKHLNRIRADVRRLTRLVDASTAFCRGMALVVGTGGTAPQTPAGYEGQA